MSYPFEYLRSRNWRIETGVAYVLHPFGGVGDKLAEGIVREAVGEEQMEYRSAKSSSGAAPILNEIMQGIAEADLVIGVLATPNPNVFWELGLAMSWKPATQVMTISRKGMSLEKIPFNIRGFRHVFIRPESRHAKGKIRAEIRQLRQRHSSLRDEAVVSTHNSLGPAELDVAFNLGGRGNFVLQSNGNGLQQVALGNLCRLGVLALSTKIKDEGTEYSFYWTALGNLVLQKLGVCEAQVVKARLKELTKTRPEIRFWRGGQVFGPIISSP